MSTEITGDSLSPTLKKDLEESKSPSKKVMMTTVENMAEMYTFVRKSRSTQDTAKSTPTPVLKSKIEFKPESRPNSQTIVYDEKSQLGDGVFDKPSVIISTWNVNGLKGLISKGEIDDYIVQYDPDIICFNETRVNNQIEDKNEIRSLFPEPYYLFLNCCKAKTYYSGVAIATKYKPINVTHDMGVPELDQEGRVLTAEFQSFILVAVYTVNSGENLKRLDYRIKEWDPAFRKYVKGLKSKGKAVVICGDLNVSHHEIDLYDPNGNRNKTAGFTDRERESFSELLDAGFYDVYRKLHPAKIDYTHWTVRRKDARKLNKGWRLDYFLVSKEHIDEIEAIETRCDVMGSDHCPVELTIKVPAAQVSTEGDSKEGAADPEALD